MITCGSRHCARAGRAKGPYDPITRLFRSNSLFRVARFVNRIKVTAMRRAFAVSFQLTVADVVRMPPSDESGLSSASPSSTSSTPPSTKGSLPTMKHTQSWSSTSSGSRSPTSSPPSFKSRKEKEIWEAHEAFLQRQASIEAEKEKERIRMAAMKAKSKAQIRTEKEVEKTRKRLEELGVTWKSWEAPEAKLSALKMAAFGDVVAAASEIAEGQKEAPTVQEDATELERRRREAEQAAMDDIYSKSVDQLLEEAVCERSSPASLASPALPVSEIALAAEERDELDDVLGLYAGSGRPRKEQREAPASKPLIREEVRKPTLVQPLSTPVGNLPVPKPVAVPVPASVPVAAPQPTQAPETKKKKGGLLGLFKKLGKKK